MCSHTLPSARTVEWCYCSSSCPGHRLSEAASNHSEGRSSSKVPSNILLVFLGQELNGVNHRLSGLTKSESRERQQKKCALEKGMNTEEQDWVNPWVSQQEQGHPQVTRPAPTGGEIKRGGLTELQNSPDTLQHCSLLHYPPATAALQFTSLPTSHCSLLHYPPATAALQFTSLLTSHWCLIHYPPATAVYFITHQPLQHCSLLHYSPATGV